MAGEPDERMQESVGAWAKSLHFAIRAAMDAILRPHGLGTTQYYVLYQLAHHGPTLQRDLGRLLQVERATLSGIVAALVGKGLIDQSAAQGDQRQRVLRLTGAGSQLWDALPDPVPAIRAIGFDGADPAELAVAVRVLSAATRRLNEHTAAGAGS